MTDLSRTKRRWLIVILAVLGVTLLGLYYVYVIPGQIARARWAEIGRPMPEFEASLNSTEKNQSLLDLFQERERLGEVNYSQDIHPVLAVWDSKDTLSPLKFTTPWLDSHSDELLRIYQRILEREVPSWTMNYRSDPYTSPHSGKTYLIAVIYIADARRRLSLGDQAGASKALNACLRIRESFQNRPDASSLMNRIRISKWVTSIQIYLPGEAEPWENISNEVKTLRESYRDGVQLGALKMLKWSFMRPKLSFPNQIFNWSSWVRRFQEPSPLQTPASLAETVERTTKPEYLSTIDLENSKSKLSSRFLYEWRELQIYLLHYEHTKLIRLLRNRLQNQQEVKSDEFPSSVIPGAHWIVTLDPVLQNANIRLNPIPSWTRPLSQEWILPLDGSKSWQFAPVR